MNYSDIEKVITDIMLTESFFGHLFLGLNKTITDKVPTMAVGYNPAIAGIELFINPEFWDKYLTTDDKKQTQRLRYGLMKHEILHIVFKHIFRYKDFSSKDLYGMAVDIVVNQFITDGSFEELPVDRCALETFPDFKLQPNQTTEYYYSRLLEERSKVEEILGQGQCQDGSESGKGKGNSKGEKSKDSGDNGDPQQGDGSGQDGDQKQEGQGDGSGDGEGQGGDDNESEGSGGPQSNSNYDKLNPSQKILANMMGKDNHKKWGEMSELSSSMQDFVEESVTAMLEDHIKKTQSNSKQWGTVPAHLKTYLEELLKSRVPSVDWKRELRRFIGFSERRYCKTSMKKESRRYGTNPGIRHKRKKRVLVAVDTSGSVGDESLQIFFAELEHIYKADNGTEMTIVECDTQIGHSWVYKGRTPVTVTGRGGTDFTAPIVWANNDGKFDAVVYFTDGFGPCPEVNLRPNKNKVLWMICPNGCTLESLAEFPGRKVLMPENPKKK